MNNKLKNKNFIVSTHASDIDGPPHYLVKYLRSRSDYLVFMSFPLSKDDLNRPYFKLWRKGNLIEEKRSKLMLKPFLLNYLKDIILVFLWNRKIRKKYSVDKTIYIGCNNLLASIGSRFKKIYKLKASIFYAIDYSDKRFENKFLNDLYLKIDELAAIKSDYVWSNTNRTRKIRQKQGVKKESNVLVPNGASTEVIKVSTKDVDKDNIKIGYYGYISEGKGLQYLIKALDLIEENNFSLDIIGYGPYLNDLREIASQSTHKDRINFLGKKGHDEIMSMVGNYDICVNLINDKEGYLHYCDPLKIKEALASNVPALISNIPEISEVIDKKNLGIVVKNSESKKEISSVLQKLFENSEILNEFKSNIEKIRSEFFLENIYEKAFSAIK